MTSPISQKYNLAYVNKLTYYFICILQEINSMSNENSDIDGVPLPDAVPPAPEQAETDSDDNSEEEEQVTLKPPQGNRTKVTFST